MVRLVWWPTMALVLAVCLSGVKGKEAGVEKQQQHGGGETDSRVRSRIREITNLITRLMQGFMSSSSHDKPDSGLKELVEEELENEILEDLDFSMDGERELSHTNGKGRAEDPLITKDTLTTSKENLPNDALSSRDSNVPNEALSDAEKSPRSKDAINSDKRYQSTPNERLNDHLHYDVSADPSVPTCRKDDTIGSCSDSGPIPITPELSDDADMEMKTSVSTGSSEDKASRGIRIADAVNGGGEAVEDKIFNTDTVGDSEEAFNSISADSEAMPPDSTSDENTNMDSDSDGDFLEGDDEYESDDYGLNLSDLSDSDDSSDSEMLYMNEVEHDNMGYDGSSDEYDTNTSSDEEDEEEGEGQEDEDEHEDENEHEDEEDRLPADVGFEVEGEVEGEAKVWNGEQDDTKVVIQSQFTHA